MTLRACATAARSSSRHERTTFIFQDKATPRRGKKEEERRRTKAILCFAYVAALLSRGGCRNAQLVVVVLSLFAELSFRTGANGTSEQQLSGYVGLCQDWTFGGAPGTAAWACVASCATPRQLEHGPSQPCYPSYVIPIGQ